VSIGTIPEKWSAISGEPPVVTPAGTLREQWAVPSEMESSRPCGTWGKPSAGGRSAHDGPAIEACLFKEVDQRRSHRGIVICYEDPSNGAFGLSAMM
jgi:hypothetical protein